MKTDVNLPPGTRQRLFLYYLNSQLRTRTPGFSGGSARYRGDGSFESSITGPFSVDQEQIPLTWRVVKSPEGNLSYLWKQFELMTVLLTLIGSALYTNS
jgi:hypothetical protein